jgi:phosphoribosylaminoimidazolecarboxamide formyltransferase/IMP cyclohydrolase
LISVSDKRGLVDFARALQSMGIEIISTGGTHATLAAHGIQARQVSDITGFPEILDGRVKTLHPRIHAGLLAVNDNPHHRAQLEQHGIAPIDMVVVNLYPFEQTIAREGILLHDAVEQIDIGGPSMLRAAAKNYEHRVAVVNPDRYDGILKEMRSSGGVVSSQTCWTLAREVFRHTSAYDAVIAQYLDRTAGEEKPFPSVLHIIAPGDQTLRYGENPHQHAALYGSFSTMFQKLHGKELSYNNIGDIAAAAQLAAEFDEPTVVIVKHMNPCGVGSGATLTEAYGKAFATDTKSPFGGIVAVNRPLDLQAAEKINEVFTEVIIAPDYAPPVLDFLRKKKDRRILRQTIDLRTLTGWDVRSVPGGYLVQDRDGYRSSGDDFKVVTKRGPTEQEQRAMHFAWRVAKHVKSNAIVYALDDRTIGIGAGQMSRFDSARIAAMKAEEAGLSVRGTAAASDAFFPFADALLELIRAGATAVVQPGGSVRDEEVIHAADEHNIAMVCTGTRHFRH